ncbi:MAG: uncharacterized protein KVP18_002155 [Porospora cf. gigantea A]|nr:MAG: hypothetical protein KVP18_002155 [Porospora cf. gigantea A]
MQCREGMKRESIPHLREFCKAMERGDSMAASNELGALSRSNFTKKTKHWILALKKATRDF